VLLSQLVLLLLQLARWLVQRRLLAGARSLVVLAVGVLYRPQPT
jgi:hypothetical protein